MFSRGLPCTRGTFGSMMRLVLYITRIFPSVQTFCNVFYLLRLYLVSIYHAKINWGRKWWWVCYIRQIRVPTTLDVFGTTLLCSSAAFNANVSFLSKRQSRRNAFFRIPLPEALKFQLTHTHRKSHTVYCYDETRYDKERQVHYFLGCTYWHENDQVHRGKPKHIG